MVFSLVIFSLVGIQGKGLIHDDALLTIKRKKNACEYIHYACMTDAETKNKMLVNLCVPICSSELSYFKISFYVLKKQKLNQRTGIVGVRVLIHKQQKIPNFFCYCAFKVLN